MNPIGTIEIPGVILDDAPVIGTLRVGANRAIRAGTLPMLSMIALSEKAEAGQVAYLVEWTTMLSGGGSKPINYGHLASGTVTWIAGDAGAVKPVTVDLSSDLDLLVGSVTPGALVWLRVTFLATSTIAASSQWDMIGLEWL